jgi:radical SAM protein with 4Fe4S-binding SPASM domain
VTPPAVSIVVPVLDELAGARRLLEEVAAWRSPWPFELLFVDGGSQDGTAELLRAREEPWVRTLSMPRGAGFAAAWRAGLAAARGEVRATMDGDGVHGLAGVERLVAAIAAGADLAVACRYGPGGSGMPGRTWSARLASLAAARAFAARYRLPVRDPLHGFRARSARAYAALRPHLEGLDGNVLVGWETVSAARLGLRLAEISIPYGRRVAGADKKRLLREGLRFARVLGRAPAATAAPAAALPQTAPAAALPAAPAAHGEAPFSSFELRILSHHPAVKEIRRGGLPFPRMAILYPVYGCNLRCVGCEYAAHNEAPTHLPLERWFALLDELAQGGTMGVELCGGGEPLLHPGVVEAVVHGARAGLRFGALTNGTCVSGRFLAEALPHLAYVRVTLDAATPETYARARPAPGASPWPTVLENVRRLLAARRPGTEISLKFLVHRLNRAEILPAVALARALGVDSIQFKAARGDPSALDPEETRAVSADLARARAAAGAFPVLGSVEKLTMRRRCELTPLQTTIDARGDVYLCCYFSHRAERHRIGNVLTQRFGEIWGGPRHAEVVAAVRPEECSRFDCRFVRYHQVLDRWMGPRDDGLAFL